MGREDTDTLIEKLAGELHPVRAMRFREGLGWLSLALTVTLAMVLVWLGIRSDVMAGHLSPLFLISQGLFLILGLAAGTTTLVMANPNVGNRHDGWKWALAMGMLLPAAAIIIAIVNMAHQPAFYIPEHDIYCLVHGLGFGALTAVVLTFWLRRGAPASPEQAGLLAGIASGALGVFAYAFSCAFDSIYHVGFWHAIPVAIAGTIGRLVIPPLIRW